MRTAALLLSCVIAVGCASKAQQAAVREQVNRAAAAYEAARSDPYARTYAPFPLHDAQTALTAVSGTRDLARQQHLGYIAERRAQTALAIAEWRRSEQDMLALGKETAEIVAQSREREARLARADAETRGKELDALSRKGEDDRRRLETLKGDLERMKSDAQARPARPPEAQVVVMPGDVLFTTGTADVAPGGARSLDKLVLALERNPNLTVLVEGHTDSTGSDKANLSLSEKRAEAVKQVLVGKGIRAERITARGYGKRYPVAPNDSPSGRQQNRRAEVVVVDETSQAPSASR
jgi:outer membrane protein OmpA-like peptidoglycan-associated protein